MGELLGASLTFPTVVFTVGLGVALAYWLLVMLGALGLDGVDADVDADVDVDMPLALGLLGLQRLKLVPITVAFSMVVLLSWLVSILATRVLAPILLTSLSGTVTGWLLLVGSLLIAMPIASFVVIPLAPLFHTHEAPSRHSLVGKVVEISTGQVDRKFGQARLEDGGAGMILQVRCASEKGLKRGDKALIVEHDDTAEYYEVEPLDDLLSNQRH